MKNLISLLMLSFILFGCEKTDAPKKDEYVYTAESRPVTEDMYNFVIGKWVLCFDHNTFVEFKEDTLIWNYVGSPRDTFWYKLDRLPNDGINIIRKFGLHDSIERNYSYLEWKSDNTFYIGGIKFCR